MHYLSPQWTITIPWPIIKKKITSFIGLSKTYVVNQSSNCLNFTHLIERFKERERCKQYVYFVSYWQCALQENLHIWLMTVWRLCKKACSHKHVRLSICITNSNWCSLHIQHTLWMHSFKLDIRFNFCHLWCPPIIKFIYQPLPILRQGVEERHDFQEWPYHLVDAQVHLYLSNPQICIFFTSKNKAQLQQFITS